MKICFINPTVLLRRPIVDLAQIFTSQGHEVAILTPGKVDDIMARESDVKAEKIPAVSMIRVPSYEIASVLWSFPLNVTFIKTIQKILDTYDIVHIWAPYYILSLAPLLFRKKKAKIVLTFDTFPGFSFRLGGFFMNTAMKVYTVMASRIFNRADKITIYGNQLLPYAKKIGLDQSRIQKLPTGIFLEKKDQRMYNSRKDRHVILFVGLLNDRKGVNTIISVAKKLENTSCNFVLVGDGPSRKKYEAMVAEQNLQQVIRFVGSSTKVRSYYENADIFSSLPRERGCQGLLWKL
jgi:glycosyltransferase involved in cell wall biosynthesis